MATNQPSSEPAQQRLAELLQAFALCQTPEVAGRFLRDLCTPQEMDAFAERWYIARLLAAGGHSYRAISQMTGASTTTIGRVARFLQQEEYEGYQLILSRLADTQGAPHVSRET